MPSLNLQGLPWFLGLLIIRTLANEKCSPDLVLVLAEAIEECARELPAQTVYREPCDRVVAQLRDRAAHYAAGRHLAPEAPEATP